MWLIVVASHHRAVPVTGDQCERINPFGSTAPARTSCCCLRYRVFVFQRFFHPIFTLTAKGLLILTSFQQGTAAVGLPSSLCQPRSDVNRKLTGFPFLQVLKHHTKPCELRHSNTNTVQPQLHPHVGDLLCARSLICAAAVICICWCVFMSETAIPKYRCWIFVHLHRREGTNFTITSTTFTLHIGSNPVSPGSQTLLRPGHNTVIATSRITYHRNVYSLPSRWRSQSRAWS